MLRSNFMKRKLRSRKGITLVETVCAIMILAIVCVGVLNAVAFSREMIYSNNSREKASDKAQLIADELIAISQSKAPTDTNVAVIQTEFENFANNTTGVDVQNAEIGKVKRVNSFSSGPQSTDALIEYIVTPVTDDTCNDSEKKVIVAGIEQRTIIHDVKQTGWDIQVRVYYKRIGGKDEYRVEEVRAFAPQKYATS